MPKFNQRIKILLFLPLLLGSFFLLFKYSRAQFSDTETVLGNSIQVGVWETTPSETEPTPTPTQEVPLPTATSTPISTPTPSFMADHIVISEVQIDGGTGQANDNDFIELYNPTTSSLNLSGFRLVKRTGSSSNDTNIFTFRSIDNIPAHGFFLWAQKSGNNNYADTISADVFSSDTLGANNSIALRQGDLDTGTIIDALSWNSAASSLKEGTEFSPNPGVNQSMERKAYSTSDTTSMMAGSDVTKGNAYDSNNNSNDFILRTLSLPQNTTSATETP